MTTAYVQMELAERERHLCVLGGLDAKRRKLPEKRTMRSAAFQGARAPPKRGRGRGRGAGRPGRPPGNRRSHSDLLAAMRSSPPWVTSLPMCRQGTSWNGAAPTMLPFPVFSSAPLADVPTSTTDVTSAAPPATSAPSECDG